MSDHRINTLHRNSEMLTPRIIESFWSAIDGVCNKVWVVCLCGICCCEVGCDAEPANYRETLLAVHRVSSEHGHEYESFRALVMAALLENFGTLDAPRLPEKIASETKYKGLLDFHQVERSAGPVRRIMVDGEKVEYGLFRKHCAVCHGASGDGVGSAAALLSPYPRDFRRGTFKYSNQGQGKPPSHADLVKTIAEGIPGTAMPAMRTLDANAYFRDDCEALASYVQFIAMRGEVERRLWLEVVPELDSKIASEFRDTPDAQAIPNEFRRETDRLILETADKWLEVVSQPVPTLSSDLAFQWPEDLNSGQREAMVQSAKRGQELFRSEATGCVQCHGEQADGNGRFADYDEWTKDWTIRAGIDPRVASEWKPLKPLGLLKPIPAQSRNLQLGVFRGGAEPSLIFQRIAHGIGGTPMPAVPKAESSPVGLNEDQIWDLVNYCQAVGYLPNEELRP